MTRADLKDVEFFVFMDNMVLESVFSKRTSKIPSLFEIVLRLHQENIRGELIFYVVHIVGTRMVEEGIDSIYR